MPKPKNYGSAVNVDRDGTLSLKHNSFVVTPEPEMMRWVALLQFCLLTGGTAMSVGVHTVIIAEYQKYFALTIFQLDLLNTIFLGSYLVVGGFVMKIFTKFGLKGGMKAASFCFLLGSLIKVVCVYYNRVFVAMATAQFLTAIAINFAMAGPSLLSSVWFPDNERTFSTTIASQADNIGIACSMLVPSLIVTTGHAAGSAAASLSHHQLRKALQQHQQHGHHAAAAFTTLAAAPTQDPTALEHEMLAVYLVILAIAVADSVLTFVIIPAAPKVPMSVQATDPDRPADSDAAEAIRPSMLGMFRSVSHSTPYILLSVAVALSIGVYWTYSAIFAQILVPFNITETESGTLGSLKILLSVPPAMLIGKYVDRTRRYKSTLLISMIVTVFAYAGCIYALEHSDAPWLPVFLLHIPLGVAQSVQMPIALEYMVEITFPVNPSISAGVFMYGLRILCTLVITAAPVLLPAHASRKSALIVLLLYTAMCAVGTILVAVVSSPLRRFQAEHGDMIDEGVDFEAIIAQRTVTPSASARRLAQLALRGEIE